MEQIIEKSITAFDTIISSINCKRFLLVCDSSFDFLPASVQDIYNNYCDQCIRFSDFTSNPLYEEMQKGVALFKSEACSAIVAVGGGSAIDVAKCIKLYCKMDDTINYLEQEIVDTGVPLVAIPTTAGTGSESTRHAVIYYKGVKQSISHESIVPEYVILESSVLKTLPVYQKKCTMLDALCQAIESWWSVNSTEESISYSQKAIDLIVQNLDSYIDYCTEDAAAKIMLAANYAGRAINITATTAAHAMSYKLTSMYKLPHGHAVALCLPKVWRYMLENPQLCVDERGSQYLSNTMSDIAEKIGCSDAKAAVVWFENIIKKLGISSPKGCLKDIEILASSVNTVRLKNNPVKLDVNALKSMYQSIVRI